MKWYIGALIAVLCATQASAQTQDVVIQWYGSPTCDNDGNVTTVNTKSARCNSINDGTSYVVNCNSNSTGGTYRACTDTLCATCSGALTFENSQCTTSNGFVGSSAAEFTCGSITSGAEPLSYAVGGLLATAGLLLAVFAGAA